MSGNREIVLAFLVEVCYIIIMTHEEYLQKSSLFPLERYFAGRKLQHHCSSGHLVYCTPEEALAGRKCAHCFGWDNLSYPGFTLVDVFTSKITKRKKAVLLDGLGRKHICDPCDIANGILPNTVLPELRGLYLYYIRLEGGYKIGVSANPYMRLHGRIPHKVLWLQYYDRADSARAEEARIKSNYEKMHKGKARKLLKGEKGYTELFEYDILGLDK